MSSQIPTSFKACIEKRFNEVVLPIRGLVNFTEGLPLSIRQVLIPDFPRERANREPATPPPTIDA